MKVSIIGAGKVGAQLGQRLVLNNFLDKVVLLDIDLGKAKGTAADINHFKNLKRSNTRVIGTSNYKEIKGSDVVVVAAGAPRKEKDDREDLLSKNTRIIKKIAKKLNSFVPEAVYITVTNPIDVINWVLYNQINSSREKFIGMAGVLDSSRFCYYLSEKADVPVSQVNGLVIGSHSDKMVPLPEKTSINGVPCKEFFNEKEITDAVQKTKDGGNKVIRLKNESAFFAPSIAIEEMIKSILFNKKEIFSASVILEGEYGFNELSIGVPVVLGEKGVNKIIELDLSKETSDAFKESIETISNKIKELRD